MPLKSTAQVLWTSAKSQTAKSKPGFVTIVIPVLNEEKHLPLLLEDLAQQSYQDFSVIVVDGNSEDQTIDRIKTFEKKLDLTVVQTQKRSASHQRNLGGVAAKTEWVIFMDADNRLPAYFLDGIRYQLAKQPQTDLFTTLIKTAGEEKVDKAVQHVINLSLEMYNTINKPQAFGAMIGVKTQVFKKIKFDEATTYLEDSLFVKTAVKQNFTFKVFRQPRYYYSLRRLKREGTLTMLRKGASIQLEFLQGKTQFNDDRYPMLGGAYHEDHEYHGDHDEHGDQRVPLLGSLNSYLRQASAKQLQQVRKLLQAIKVDSD